MHHHEVEYHLKRLICYQHSQGHIAQIIILWPILTRLLNCWSFCNQTLMERYYHLFARWQTVLRAVFTKYAYCVFFFFRIRFIMTHGGLVNMCVWLGWAHSLCLWLTSCLHVIWTFFIGVPFTLADGSEWRADMFMSLTVRKLGCLVCYQISSQYWSEQL